MKKFYLLLSALLTIDALMLAGTTTAQTVADFENLVLADDSCWNGSDLSGSFVSGNASFVNRFTDWGGGITSWSGFAYSNKRDTTSQSYTNEFSAITALGYGASDKYAVCYVSAFEPLPKIRMNGIALGDTLSGFFVTNSTYGYLTMRNGGGPARKFGGATGADPDWFALVVYGYKDGSRKSDSVTFYLADYRFTASAQDYIVKDWQWVDLSVLGMVDSLEFNMFSSDTGAFGMNNPSYFCMDNLITDNNSAAGIAGIASEKIDVYPCPAEDWLIIRGMDENSVLHIFDITGKQVRCLQITDQKIHVKDLAGGIYFLQIHNGNSVYYTKFVKK
ncbi:MAG TPA: DUF4465 domain-containing protein [Bacteroidales bacterium]|nr:DUF4465 domain-containing protein [Bacteroidales bacterium]